MSNCRKKREKFEIDWLLEKPNSVFCSVRNRKRDKQLCKREVKRKYGRRRPRPWDDGPPDTVQPGDRFWLGEKVHWTGEYILFFRVFELFEKRSLIMAKSNTKARKWFGSDFVPVTWMINSAIQSFNRRPLTRAWLRCSVTILVSRRGTCKAGQKRESWFQFETGSNAAPL